MAKRKPSSTRGAVKITTPRARRIKALPLTDGTTIHYIDSSLAVVVSRRAGGGGGGGGLGATIDVCKCVKTEFKCTTKGSHTTCKEECVEWECTEVVKAPA